MYYYLWWNNSQWSRKIPVFVLGFSSRHLYPQLVVARYHEVLHFPLAHVLENRPSHCCQQNWEEKNKSNMHNISGNSKTDLNI